MIGGGGVARENVKKSQNFDSMQPLINNSGNEGAAYNRENSISPTLV
jgi:hypothetical protein